MVMVVPTTTMLIVVFVVVLVSTTTMLVVTRFMAVGNPLVCLVGCEVAALAVLCALLLVDSSHVEIASFGVCYHESGYRGVGVHCSVVGNLYPYLLHINEAVEGEDERLVGHRGVAYGGAYSCAGVFRQEVVGCFVGGISPYRGAHLVVQPLGGSFDKAVGQRL